MKRLHHTFFSKNGMQRTLFCLCLHVLFGWKNKLRMMVFNALCCTMNDVAVWIFSLASRMCGFSLTLSNFQIPTQFPWDWSEKVLENTYILKTFWMLPEKCGRNVCWLPQKKSNRKWICSTRRHLEIYFSIKNIDCGFFLWGNWSLWGGKRHPISLHRLKVPPWIQVFQRKFPQCQSLWAHPGQHGCAPGWQA